MVVVVKGNSLMSSATFGSGSGSQPGLRPSLSLSTSSTQQHLPSVVFILNIWCVYHCRPCVSFSVTECDRFDRTYLSDPGDPLLWPHSPSHHFPPLLRLDSTGDTVESVVLLFVV